MDITEVAMYCTDMYPLEDQICDNCLHMTGDSYPVSMYSGDRLTGHKRLSVCRKGALDGDIPGAVTLVAPESHCRDHAGYWEPSADYLSEYRESLSYAADPSRFNGVAPGVDYPGTLGPGHAA